MAYIAGPDDLNSALDMPYSSVLLRLVTGKTECSGRVAEQLKPNVAAVRIVAFVTLPIRYGFVHDVALGLGVAVVAEFRFRNNQLVSVFGHVVVDVARVALPLGRRAMEEPASHLPGVALRCDARLDRAGRPFDRVWRTFDRRSRLVVPHLPHRKQHCEQRCDDYTSDVANVHRRNRTLPGNTPLPSWLRGLELLRLQAVAFMRV